MRPQLEISTIDFLRSRRIMFALSAVLVVASLLALGVRGLNLGLEFTGGVVMEVRYPEAAELDPIRVALEDAGYPGAAVQRFGTARDVLVRLPPQPDGVGIHAIRDEALGLLRGPAPGVEMRAADFVDAQVGEEPAEQGGLAMLFALLMILAYVAFRFQWKFSVGAVAALAHDVIITLGIFSLFLIPFDLAALAAILAVIGYSLNDTIVIFDRIRENFVRTRGETPEGVMNSSLNQTLSRTLVTGATTLLVLGALLFVGGEALRGFSLALIIGVLVGTYSSIYMASAVALEFNVSGIDLMPARKEEDEALQALP